MLQDIGRLEVSVAKPRWVHSHLGSIRIPSLVEAPLGNFGSQSVVPFSLVRELKTFQGYSLCREGDGQGNKEDRGEYQESSHDGNDHGSDCCWCITGLFLARNVDNQRSQSMCASMNIDKSICLIADWIGADKETLQVAFIEVPTAISCSPGYQKTMSRETHLQDSRRSPSS